MDFYSGFETSGGYGRDAKGFFLRSKSKVLLREPEACPVCTRVYISLYPLRHCEDHDGLDEV